MDTDFRNLVKKCVKCKNISEQRGKELLTAFSDDWPKIAPKLLSRLKANSKVEAVKQFIKDHAVLLEKGTHSSELALLILPNAVHVTKKIKQFQSAVDGNVPVEKNISLSKEDCAKAFVLPIRSVEDENQYRSNHESWLTSINQECYPYILVCGKIEHLSQIALVLKGDKYLYESLTKAFEDIFKCMYALRSWPIVTDHIFYFFESDL